jgi:hypothetical protein
MTFRIGRVVVSHSLLAAAVSIGVAQPTQPSQNNVVVGSGNDLRCRLEKGLRITRPGESVTAKLIEPVYIGTTLAIPTNSMLKGHVASISVASLSKRTGRLLDGDFTPPRTAGVTFDHVILPSGTVLPIHTGIAVGISDVKAAQYLPKSQRPGIRQKIKEAAAPLKEPNKLQRISQAAVTSLPYHPEFLDQGTIFDASLLSPIDVPVPPQPVEQHSQPSDNYLHLRLLTPVNSDNVSRGALIDAAVSRPYYNSDHVLVYPAGTKLGGMVNRATSAKWMKKNGDLFFSFHSVQMANGTATAIDATVAGLQAPGAQRLAVGEEGELRATTSLLSRLQASVSLIKPSTAITDSTQDKTALQRQGEGRNGFGWIGAGAAQASASTAIGFGYFGAAKKLYGAFIAKGSNVELPVNTPILLRVNERSGTSGLNEPIPVPVVADLSKE